MLLLNQCCSRLQQQRPTIMISCGCAARDCCAEPLSGKWAEAEEGSWFGAIALPTLADSLVTLGITRVISGKQFSLGIQICWRRLRGFTWCYHFLILETSMSPSDAIPCVWVLGNTDHSSVCTTFGKETRTLDNACALRKNLARYLVPVCTCSVYWEVGRALDSHVPKHCSCQADSVFIESWRNGGKPTIGLGMLFPMDKYSHYMPLPTGEA